MTAVNLLGSLSPIVLVHLMNLTVQVLCCNHSPFSLCVCVCVCVCVHPRTDYEWLVC